MLWIWFIGVILIGSFAAYMLGKTDPYDFEDAIIPIILAVILWPIILAIVIAAAPFAVPFIIGQREKKKRLEAKKAERLKNK